MAANESDISVVRKLVREDNDVVNMDAGYVGIEKRKEIVEDEYLSKVEYRENSGKGAPRKMEKEIYNNVMEHLDYIEQPDWDAEI